VLCCDSLSTAPKPVFEGEPLICNPPVCDQPLLADAVTVDSVASVLAVLLLHQRRESGLTIVMSEVSATQFEESLAPNGFEPLLQGNHDTRRSLYVAYGCLKGNVTSSKAGWYRQVDLVQTGAGQSRECRGDAHVVDPECDRNSGWRGSGEYHAGRHGRIRGPKPCAE
jgi:hypothetical protein